ncbi:hypothetical protein SK128_019789, partial [Halocaridina rubra]
MDEEVEDILKCHVCLGDFNDTKQRPLLLPACGHTFCAYCLENLQRQSRVGCPECRKANAIQPVATLPVNYVVLSLSQAKQKQKQEHERAESAPVPHCRQSSRRRCSDPPPLDEVSYSPSRALRRSGSTSSRHDQFLFHSPERVISGSSHGGAVGSLRMSPSRQLRRSASVRSDLHPHQVLGLHTDTVGMSPPPPRTLRRSGSVHNDYSALSPPHHPGMLRIYDTRRAQTSNHTFLGNIHGARANPQAYHSTVTDENEKCARELQEELDFQMAIHLTFCKNASHGHDDDGAACTSRSRWQYPANDELRTALLLSKVNL